MQKLNLQNSDTKFKQLSPSEMEFVQGEEMQVFRLPPSQDIEFYEQQAEK
jgi:hypothetical protein